MQLSTCKTHHIHCAIMALAGLAFALMLLAAAQAVGAEAAECAGQPCSTSARRYLPLVSFRRPTPETLFGVQMYGLLDTPGAALDLAQGGNVSWIRTQLQWRQVEPVNVSPDGYDFGAFDDSIKSGVDRGMRLIATIFDNPQWAATYLNGPIDKVGLDEFGQFFGAAVERYDGDGYEDAPGSPVIRYWELYNEPDSGDEVRAQFGQGFWGDHGEQYAQLLCVANWYAHNASSDAKIVMGGVAHDWFRTEGGPFVESFVDDVLKAGGGKCIDVMNFHYYPVFASRWTPYGNGIIGKSDYLRAKLANYGLTRPMMCTEAGWHSDADNALPSSPQKQAEFAVKLYAQSRAANLVVNIWWTWTDPGATVGSYGLLTQALTPKPSYFAYRYAAQRLGTAAFSRVLSPDELGDPGLEGYLFASAPALYVLWSNDDVVKPVKLNGSQVRILDPFGSLLGAVTDAQDGAADGRVTVAVGSMPIYVEATP